MKLKTAMMSDKTKEMAELLKGKNIHCAESKNGLSSIKVEDLSLYHNVIMVRYRIWAPESIRYAFFNNLHLGYRSVDMNQRLALRSVYWTGLSKDLTGFFNECSHCNRTMDKNKKLPDLPEDETTAAFECISMDGFHTDGGENGVAFIDRHTGYIWACKTGDKATGTARVIMGIRPGKIYFLHPNQELVKKIPPRFKGKITPLPPPKMSFSSKKGHFKTHDAHFLQKKSFCANQGDLE